MRWLLLVVVVLAACAPASSGFGVPRWYVANLSLATIAPDGTRAVLVGRSEAALVYGRSGLRIATIPIASRVPAVFSHDGNWFAIVDGVRGCVALWQVAPPHEEDCSVETRSDAVVAFSPDDDAIAIADDNALVRWSLPFRTEMWRIDGHPHPRFVAWPAHGTIVLGTGDGTIGVNSANGHVRWSQPEEIFRFLGSYRGDGVVQLDDAVARLDLESGALRARTPASLNSLLLDDGYVVTIDYDHSLLVKLGGGVVQTIDSPRGFTATTANREGSLAAYTSDGHVELWNLRDGARIRDEGMQLGAIVALDADDRSVVSASTDGTVLVRDPRGRLLEQGEVKDAQCWRFAVDAPSRQALCLDTSEWLDLDRGRSRRLDQPEMNSIAVARGLAWAHGAPHDREGFTHLASHHGVVVYGGAHLNVDTPHDTWEGLGLYARDRSGREVVLDPDLRAEHLAIDRDGERVVVSTASNVELWRHGDGPLAWSQLWSSTSATHGPIAVDGAHVVIAIPDAIAVLDAATGRELQRIAEPSPVTALALHGNTVYAGTYDGTVVTHTLTR
ncbi:MAG TPA: PQQ-binding-like beta-propeller repeat protein [Kofleriaceae bacterium]|jgi:WD40 repeat protein